MVRSWKFASAKASRVLAAGLMLAVSANANALVPANPPQAQRTVADELALKQLCLRIAESVRKLPDGAATEDVEAAIIYALSQSNPDPKYIDEALRCAGGGATGNVQQAFANVQQSYFKKQQGTGAIAHGAGNSGSGSFFSAPVVGVGGGGSNYTPSN